MNMHDEPRSEYRNECVTASTERTERSACTALVRVEARRQMLQRPTHALVIRVTSDGLAGLPLPEWWRDLRRGGLRVYGGLLRFLDASSERLTQTELLAIPEMLRWYILDLYEEQARRRAKKRA
jgi:hypothetical protein